MKLKVNQKKQVKNWDDTCLNIYHRVDKNSVIVEHIYRYAPTIKKTMSYKKFQEWQNDIKREETLFKGGKQEHEYKRKSSR